MSLESADFIKNLIQSNPPGSDPKSQGDDHLRLIKHVLLTQFAGLTDGIAITKTESQINNLLQHGEFGLGGGAAQINETELDFGNRPSGFYVVAKDGSGYLPTNDWAFLLHIDSQDNGQSALQLLVPMGNAIDVYVRRQTGGTFNWWVMLWSASNTPKQATPLDLTPGTILTPASFGVGLPAVPTFFDLNNAAFHPQSAARWMSTQFTNGPVAAGTENAQVSWEPTLGDATAGKMSYYGSASGNTWVRYLNGGVWGNWDLVFTGNVLLNATGWHRIGGLVYQWGKAGPINDEQSISVVFPRACSGCYSVTTTPIGQWVGANAGMVSVTYIDGNGFAAYLSSTNAQTGQYFYWHAVCPK